MPECIRSTKLVLLPGMMCDERMWAAQLRSVSALADIKVGDITRCDSIAGIAASVLLQAPEYFSLAGLSMGGIVAMEMWRQQPQRIERLALLDTNFRADAPERQAIRNRQIPAAAQGGLESILRDELKPNYLAQEHRSNLALLDELLQMGLDLGDDVFVRQSLALRDRSDGTSTLPTISCPTLILCGAEDSLCPPSVHEEMAELIKGARLDIVPSCGHLSTMEQPEYVNRVLSEWLSHPIRRQNNENK